MTLQLQGFDLRTPVREVLQSLIENCPTLRVTFDLNYVVKQLTERGYDVSENRRLPPVVWAEAQAMGFIRNGLDSKRRAQWVRVNPKLCWKHGRVEPSRGSPS